ncbi:MAG: HlyD family type I secretion periplasmic adaptor subunit [Chromatiaceae bacterium]|nr:HlyD family type I secretion periplasmic adaptor subunit [Chromatiaceae bacterium]
MNDTEQTPPGPRISDTRERIIGIAILLLAVGGFALWSATAPIDSAAVAPGIVTVETSRKTVEHLDGGIVSEILVREGDTVAAGQVLIRLDETDPRTQLAMARSRYFALRAQEARLLAERDGEKQLEFPPDLAAAEADPRLRQAITGQRSLFNARRTAREGEKEVLEQRISQLEEQIEGLEGVIGTSKRRIALYQEEINALDELFSKGFSDNSKLREWERLVAELEGEISERRSTISSTRVKIGETRLQIVQISRQLASEVAQELHQVQTELAELRERILSLEKRLERTEVIAPASGQVVGLQIHTVGGVIKPGEEILDIVPQDGPLLVEARVSPTDIDRVDPGLEAELRLTAFNAANTPTVPGEVLTVSGDRLVDQSTGTPYYLARIRVTPGGMNTLGARILRPGMPVDVLIKTGERTFFEYLMRPLTDRIATAFKED